MRASDAMLKNWDTPVSLNLPEGGSLRESFFGVKNINQHYVLN
ncbi:hypothetical protein D3OALGA1CA_3887 [Olavius algarvensis associated proteobacterium Delta 3]|nr:hypothetical protein D3OALGA1CA_3887 [Olavius algarvensis associated proteobacterium Delta 3]CAB5167047.1 hypothetical protein D3OALGB2SA_5836 [Olavius algarvensis associated proteobacterium Delta 3]